MTATDQSRTQAVPLTVLTGFLGAGKTTLLNRILTGDHGLRVAVLVNDFGSINIDAELVVGVESEGDVINLANGCVCCNIRDDLVAAVTQVMARPEQPEYILLEASGVADPSGIALTFMDENMRDRIRLDSIMCVVDAEQIFAAPEMMELKLRQVAFADMLILNKVDLVTPEEIERIKAWLDDRFHRYRLVQASHGNVPLEILLSVGRFDPARLDGTSPHDQPGHPHDCDDPDCGHHVGGTWPPARSHEGLQHVELRDARAALPGSAAGGGVPSAGARLPGQRRDLHCRCPDTARGAAGRWQTRGYLAAGRVGRTRAAHANCGHRRTWRHRSAGVAENVRAVSQGSRWGSMICGLVLGYAGADSGESAQRLPCADWQHGG